MKKLFLLLLLIPSFVSAQVVFKQNQIISSTTPSLGVIVGLGVGTSTLQASSTPTIFSLFATSTTATSTFSGLMDILKNLVVGNRISASSFNATSTATSTFVGGGNFSTGAGCLAINGVCLNAASEVTGTGSADMLTSWLTSTTLTATSTPTATAYTATSTTATSTFSGGATVGKSLTVTDNITGRNITGSGLLSMTGNIGTSTFSSNVSAPNIEATNALIGDVSFSDTGNATVGGTLTASNFTGTSTLLANTFPRITNTYASSTALTVSGVGGLYVGTLTGILQGISGAVTASSTLSTFYGGTGANTLTGCLTGNGAAPITGSGTCVITTRALTVAGTANQITSSAGSQDLSADRTWTLSLPNLVVFPANASSTQLTVTGNTYLATASGNVGIGTTSPAKLFSVGGSGYLTGNLTTGISAVTGDWGNQTSDIQAYGNTSFGAVTISSARTDAANLRIASLDFENLTNNSTYRTAALVEAFTEQTSVGSTANKRGGVLTFSTRADNTAGDPTEKMRIQSNGNVGIGTTSPWRTFSVNGTGAWIGLTAASLTNNSLCVVNAGKEVQENAASSCLVSARRYKENIETLKGTSIEKIMKLNPVTYNYKADKEKKTHTGFIAESVAPIIPSAVTYLADGQAQSLEYSDITATLIDAFQKFYAEFQSLVARISGLEERLNKQDARIKALEDKLNKK